MPELTKEEINLLREWNKRDNEFIAFIEAENVHLPERIRDGKTARVAQPYYWFIDKLDDDEREEIENRDLNGETKKEPEFIRADKIDKGRKSKKLDLDEVCALPQTVDVYWYDIHYRLWRDSSDSRKEKNRKAVGEYLVKVEKIGEVNALDVEDQEDLDEVDPSDSFTRLFLSLSPKEWNEVLKAVNAIDSKGKDTRPDFRRNKDD